MNWEQDCFERPPRRDITSLRKDPRAHRLADTSKPWMPFPKAFIDIFVETLFHLKNKL